MKIKKMINRNNNEEKEYEQGLIISFVVIAIVFYTLAFGICFISQ